MILRRAVFRDRPAGESAMLGQTIRIASTLLTIAVATGGTMAQTAPPAPAQPSVQPAAAPANATPRPATASKSTADHSKFEILNGPFANGPEVTKACLTCHTEASKQVHNSIHWTWTYKNEQTGQTLGKKSVINSFCVAVPSNEPRCTSCHTGYGWKDANFDFKSEVNVDCIVCHEQTKGGYTKAPAGSGNPPAQPINFGGKIINPPDWSKVAKSVAKPDRDNCGVCHFFGGGGDGVKHGDMDSSLGKPTKALDVHMDAQGLNFGCSTCHTSESHVLSGSRYAPTAKTDGKAPLPGFGGPKANCESCHTPQPHKGEVLASFTLNNHVEKIACQTCHIPAMARGGVPTKMLWDWSTAGKMKDGKPYVEKDAKGYETYASIKGTFKWEENVKPHYAWFDGQIRYTQHDDKIDPKAIVDINMIGGSREDGKSRIWPFKVMAGKQAYDAKTNNLVYLSLFGQNDTAYWSNFDWNKAIAGGQKAVGKDYSGEFAFAETKMYWPLAHMVAPARDALACGECHARDGRLASLTGFYMPGRDSFRWLDMLGYLAIAGALAGVLIHALLRAFSRKTPSH